MPDDEDPDIHEDYPGETVEVDPDMWAKHLNAQASVGDRLGFESHITIRDTDDREHRFEIADVDRVESQGRHVRIWLRNAGIITVTGGAVAAAIALIRHRRKAKS